MKKPLILILLFLVIISFSIIIYNCASDAGAAYDSAGYSDDRNGTATGTTTDNEGTGSSETEIEDDITKKPVVLGSKLYLINPDTISLTEIDVISGLIQIILLDYPADGIIANLSRNLIIILHNEKMGFYNPLGETVEYIDIRPNLNRLKLSPDENWCLAYASLDVGSGLLNFGDISLINLTNSSAVHQSLGFNPTIITFSQNSDKLILVAEAELNAVITPLPNLSFKSFLLYDDTLGISPSTKALDVEILSAGDMAFIIRQNSSKVTIVDLSTEAIQYQTVTGQPTDIDEIPGQNQVLIISKDTGTISLMDTSSLFTETISTPPSITIGQAEVYSDGSAALLFTNSENIEQIHYFDISSQNLDTRNTVKPIKQIEIGPMDNYALLKMDGGDGDPLSELDDLFDNKAAAAVLDLGSKFSYPFVLDGLMKLSAFSEDGLKIVIIAENSQELVAFDSQTHLDTRYPLPSMPADLGIFPGEKNVFINQEHLLGRVSTINLADTEPELITYTGYLLNEGIH
jgi:hypothetical protein